MNISQFGFESLSFEEGATVTTDVDSTLVNNQPRWMERIAASPETVRGAIRSLEEAMGVRAAFSNVELDGVCDAIRRKGVEGSKYYSILAKFVEAIKVYEPNLQLNPKLFEKNSEQKNKELCPSIYSSYYDDKHFYQGLELTPIGEKLIQGAETGALKRVCVVTSLQPGEAATGSKSDWVRGVFFSRFSEGVVTEIHLQPTGQWHTRAAFMRERKIVPYLFVDDDLKNVEPLVKWFEYMSTIVGQDKLGLKEILVPGQKWLDRERFARIQTSANSMGIGMAIVENIGR